MSNKDALLLNFEQSSKVCLRQQSLSNTLAWAQYQNENERLSYTNKQRHTLSMYLQGGFETFRIDRPKHFGSPGSFCLMPKDSESRWQLGAEQQFVHLYFDDDYLKQLALKTFDIDPRCLQLPDLSYFKNAALEASFRHQIASSDWSAGCNHLLLEQITNTILVAMIHDLGVAKFKGNVQGGLAPRVLLRICEYMHCYSYRQIFLAELAELAALSEYHFCRMFKQSTAQTPQQYLSMIRIDRVKNMCSSSPLSLTEISLDCGFSNQSHMGRTFKKLVGVSPREYRKNLPA